VPRSAAQDDVPSFDDFVAARSSSLQRVAWLLTGDQHHAQDLLQAALATVWPRWDRVARSSDGGEAHVRKVLSTPLTHADRRHRWMTCAPRRTASGLVRAVVGEQKWG
jgi:DNA-directed RNA polymerase specialized sigma24 family protein